MQTFICYGDNFKQTFKILDYKRLGKQRVESRQILDLVLGISDNTWKNHPCTRMWLDYPEALKLYYNLCIKEWVDRGYNNTMKYEQISGKIERPHWINNIKLSLSHRSKLLQKEVEHYSQLNSFKHIPRDFNYWWPVELKSKNTPRWSDYEENFIDIYKDRLIELMGKKYSDNKAY